MRFLMVLFTFGSAASAGTCGFLLDLEAPITSQFNALVFDRVSYIDDMRAVTNKLVREKTISEAQAESVFAEHVLGRFAPIFVEYTFTELRQRGFNKDEAVKFVRHFDDVFTPEHQVQFARDVARAMLLTLDEAPSPENPEGLNQFLQAAHYFSLPPDLYGQFLRVWAYVRRAHPATILHFVLANIKNAGENLVEPTPPPIPSKFSLFSRRSVVEQVAVPAPEFITTLREFVRPTKDAPTLLDRARDRGGMNAADFMKSLSAVAPLGRDYVVQQKLGSLTFAQIKLLRRKPFEASTLALLEETYEKFALLDGLIWLASEVKEHLIEESKLRPPSEIEAQIPDGLLDNFQRCRHRNSTIRSISGGNDELTTKLCVLEAWKVMQSQHNWRLPNAIFVQYATKVLQHVQPKLNRPGGLGASEGLIQIAQLFDLSDREIEEVLGFFHGPSRSSPFADTLRPERWRGKKRILRTDYLNKNTPYRQAVVKIREFLEDHGQNFATLDDLIVELNEDRSPPPRTSGASTRVYL